MPSPSIGQTFDSRSNALNLIRLILALLVIVSHSIVLGGYPRSEVLWGRATLGEIAVNGFFAISGFLIAASAQRNSVPRYLWQRVLRIFPAFWVCLLLTAAVAGPIGWAAHSKGSLADYFTASSGPVRYVIVNSLLLVRQTQISGTPDHIPYPLIWNGSIWTLWPEFLCYLMLAALAFTKVLGRRRVVLVLWLLSWVVAAGIDLTGGVDVPTDSGFVHFILKVLIRFTPIFFAGAVIWLYRDKVPDNRYLFTAALLIFVGGTFLPHPDLVGPALGYVCLWASIHMPGKSIGSKYDISYGVYIYAFVVAQLFTLWHVNKWGYLPYTALTTLVTLALAGLSCVFVEQPALRLKRWTPPFIQRRTQGRL